MRVFVLGTGRCGTTTLSRAFGHATNFTAGHETTYRLQRRKKPGATDPADLWTYPDQHIECDGHLSWALGTLLSRYPDAAYIHLQRKREEVVASWQARGIKCYRGPAPMIGWMTATYPDKMSPGAYRRYLGVLYDVINDNIALALATLPAPQRHHLWLHDAATAFPPLWEKLGIEGDLDAAMRELTVKHNARKK